MKNFNKSSLPMVFFVFSLLLASVVKAETNDELSAKEVVMNFQDKLIDVMKHGQELGYQGRYDALYTPIVESHDLSKIARIVIGKQWKQLTDEQKKQMDDVFTRLSVASYAYNFKNYNGESFKFESEEETARGGIIIRSLFVIRDDKNVKFDYMLKKSGGKWKIINIIANGVSDLALKRSEYSSILKQEGFDGLITKLTGKIENYSKQ